MSILNWHAVKPLLSLRNLAWLAGFMLVFWAPFWGSHRLPALLLLLLGLFLHARLRGRLPAGREERRWSLVFLLLWVPCAISTPFSLSPHNSLVATLVLLLHYWIGLALIHGLRQGGHARLATWIGYTLLFWTLDGAVQFAFGFDLFGVPLTPDGRVVGPFGDNMNLGRYLSVLMPLLLWPLARRNPWLALALFVPVSAVAALTGMRTNIVFALLVAIGLAFVLANWKQRAALLALCLSPLLMLPFSPPLKERVLDRDHAIWLNAETWQDPAILTAELDKLLSNRVTIWDTGLQMALDRPLVGVGPHAFDPAYPRYSRRPGDPFVVASAEGSHAHHAHQMYVSSLAETGLLGLGGVLACLWLGWRWYRAAPPRARRAAAPFAASLAVVVFPLNSQPVLLAGWWFPVMMLLFCAMLVALEEGSPSDVTLD